MNNSLRQYYLKTIGIQAWALKSSVDEEIFIDYGYENFPSVSVAKKEPQLKQEPQSNVAKESISQFAKKQKVYGKKQQEKKQIAQQDNTQQQVQAVINNANRPQITDQHSNSNNIPPHSIENELNKTQALFDPELLEAIHTCKQCAGRSTRLDALVGQGIDKASVFIISDAPSAEEDQHHQYLVDKSQLLFDRMLKTIALENHYFYTGIVKCYSLDNYATSDIDIKNCREFLFSQIKHVKPSVLFVLGARQAQSLLNTKQSFNDLRGQVHYSEINGIKYPIIISYHPAYLLRNPEYKKEALDDLLRLKYCVEAAH